MSNFTRKISRNKKVEDSNNLVESYDSYVVNHDSDFLMKIETTSYNQRFFRDTKHMLNTYGLIFNNFMDFYDSENGQVRFLDFIKDSVKNNSMLNDWLYEYDYEVVDEQITYIDQYSERQNYFNMGEFFIDHYQVNVSESNLFLEDLETGKKYMYYGD